MWISLGVRVPMESTITVAFSARPPANVGLGVLVDALRPALLLGETLCFVPSADVLAWVTDGGIDPRRSPLTPVQGGLGAALGVPRGVRDTLRNGIREHRGDRPVAHAPLEIEVRLGIERGGTEPL
jgi:hypothetical protein